MQDSEEFQKLYESYSESHYSPSEVLLHIIVYHKQKVDKFVNHLRKTVKQNDKLLPSQRSSQLEFLTTTPMVYS